MGIGNSRSKLYLKPRKQGAAVMTISELNENDCKSKLFFGIVISVILEKFQQPLLEEMTDRHFC
jgi:hypothetical protein